MSKFYHWIMGTRLSSASHIQAHTEQLKANNEQARQLAKEYQDFQITRQDRMDRHNMLSDAVLLAILVLFALITIYLIYRTYDRRNK